MLYRCHPAQAARAAAPRLTARGKQAGKSALVTIDVHCHVHSPEAEARGQSVPGKGASPSLTWQNAVSKEVNRLQALHVEEQLTSIKRRLRDMDKTGIDIQALSPAPPQYYYATPPEVGRETSRLVNDNIASIVAAHPDRFVGLGTVPLQNTEMAVAELERAVKQLGLRGVEIATNVDGAELSEARFRPFFAKAQELDILIFMHPVGFTHGNRLTEHYFANIIGHPLDSTVAVSHLIFGGVLEAYPKLKICIAHGGGFLPAYSGRMDHGHGARPDSRTVIKRKPSTYLRKLYFDTIVFTHHQLEYLVNTYGSDHVLLGSDYPFDMGPLDPAGFVAAAPSLKRDEKAALLGGNAARLLKIRNPKPAAGAAKARWRTAKR